MHTENQNPQLSEDEIKKISKTILGSLRDQGIKDVKLGNVQNALAAAAGRGNWAAFKQVIKNATTPGTQTDKADPEFLNAYPLSKLGYKSEDVFAITKALKADSGVILVSGPTNSGTTTLLYAMAEMLSGNKEVVSLEQPVEIDIPGVVQIDLAAESTSMSEALNRSAEDVAEISVPEVVCVSEARTKEDFVSAALLADQGKLVIVNTHAQNCDVALKRFMDSLPSDLANSVCVPLILNQRLIKAPICEIRSTDARSPRPAMRLTNADFQEQDKLLSRLAELEVSSICIYEAGQRLGIKQGGTVYTLDAYPESVAAVENLVPDKSKRESSRFATINSVNYKINGVLTNQGWNVGIVRIKH